MYNIREIGRVKGEESWQEEKTQQMLNRRLRQQIQ